MTTQAARVSGLLAPTRDAGASDVELLNRFVLDRDDAAFAALVVRHGPMVFGVCRRIVRDWHAAEDAFQATFLVLARRAAVVVPRSAVAGWLYGVACRVARDVRRAEQRYASRERSAANASEPVAGSSDPGTDLRAVLDDELRRLPGKYRDLLVLCDLEERLRAPVAAELGIPEGTLSSRLTVALKMLAARLMKRGVAPAVAAGVALGDFGALARGGEVPRSLQASAARLGTAAPDTVPVAVASLASRAATHRAWFAVIFVLMAVGATAVAVSVATRSLLHHEGAESERPVLASAPSAPELRADGPGRILFYRAGYLTVIDPDGKNERKLSPDQKPFLYGWAKFSPDGKRIAVMVADRTNPSKPLMNLTENRRLSVRDVSGNGPSVALDIVCDQFAWSPDGAEIVCHNIRAKSPDFKNFVVNVKTQKKTEIKVGNGDFVQVNDWSRDGKHFLTTHVDGVLGAEMPSSYVCLTKVDRNEHRTLTSSDEFALWGRISPDAQRVLYTGLARSAKPPGELRVLDTKTGKSMSVFAPLAGGSVEGYCWAPDGKQIAYVWKKELQTAPVKERDIQTETYLVVCDSDGKNAKTLVTEKGVGKYLVTLGGVDWR